MHFPFPLLVCDIGGTNARFAYVETAKADLLFLPPQKTADHATCADALRAVLDSSLLHKRPRPRTILMSAAGPCEGTSIKLTNAQWDIKAQDIMSACAFEQGMMFNDFEAQALSLPALKPEWVRPIGPSFQIHDGPRLISGPGTGLGTAVLLYKDHKFIAVPTESGHMDFAPVRDEEHLFWPHIEKRLGRITAETLLSGAGLQRLHRARQASHGFERSDDDGVAIVAHALAYPHSFEADTIRAFWLLLARFVGDMAITFVASAGVTLSGGIVPRIISLCQHQEFRAAFENKAPYEHIMRAIGVQMIHVPDTVLAGLAYVAAHPDRYMLEQSRLWA